MYTGIDVGADGGIITLDKNGKRIGNLGKNYKSFERLLDFSGLINKDD